MRIKRFGTCLVLLIAFVLGLAGAASAHYVYDRGYAWEDGSRCISVRAEISHNSNGLGYTRAEAWYTQPLGTINCQSGWSRSTNYAAVKTQVDMYDAFQRRWVYCLDLGYKYNTAGAVSYMSQEHGYSKVPCGAGLSYMTWGFGYTYLSSTWQGGAHSSVGSHVLPDYS